MSCRKISLVRALLVLVLSSLSFSAMAAEVYKVSASLLYQGKAFATPTVVVKPDTPAQMVVSGSDGYRFTLVVTDLPDNKVRVSAKLDSSHGSMAPEVITRLDKAATITEGDIGLALDVHRTSG